MDLLQNPITWQRWCFAILALVMLMVDEADVRANRIPNVMVLLLLCAGLLLNAIGPVNGRGGVFGDSPGAVGIGQAVLGALVGLALFMPLHLCRAMGAGDVKLLGALGSFAGPVEIISVALSILVAGGVLAVARMLWTQQSGLVLGNVKLLLASLSGSGAHFDPATQSADRVPYALAFAGGLFAYAYWRSTGGTAFIYL